MADVALSYAHKDATTAAELRDRLRADGVSVWMDDAGEETEGAVGIPVGLSHWDVISAEFASAVRIVVLDSTRWQESDYCQREYAWCRELGKPMTFIPIEESGVGVSRIVHALASERLASEAHARLAERVNSPTVRASWLRRAAFGRRAHDAELVQATLGAEFEVTPVIRELLDSDLASAARTRRGLRRLGIAIVSVLLVLAIGALAAWIFAGRWSQEAAQAARRAEALELAQRSYQTADTVQAVQLASAAVKMDPVATSTDAARAARTRDARIRVIEMPPGEVVGGAWAPDAPIVLAYSRDRVTVVNTESGEVAEPILLRADVVADQLVVGPGGRTAVYVETSGTLRSLNLSDGTSTVIAEKGRVSAITMSDDGEIAWATTDGSVYVATYPEDGRTLDVEAAIVLPSFARALDIQGDTVAVVGDDGWVRTLHPDGDALVESAAVTVSDKPHPPDMGGYLAAVTICGDTVTGSFGGTTLLGVRFEWAPEAGTPVETGRSSRLEGRPLCTDGGALHSSVVRGDIENFSGDVAIAGPNDVVRNIGVFDPRHERAATLSPVPGRLLVLGDAAITKENLGDVNLLLPLRDRTLVVDKSLEVRDIDTGMSFGILGQATEVTVATRVAGCDAIILTDDGIYHVSCDTSATRISDATDITSVRASADGSGFVIVRSATVEVRGRDGALIHEMGLRDTVPGEVVDADLAPDGKTLALASAFGHVYEVPAGSPSVALSKPIITVPAGTNTTVAYDPGGTGLVVLSSGSRILRLEGGVVVAARQLDFPVNEVFVTPTAVYAASFADGTAVLDLATLGLIERFDNGFFTDAGSDDVFTGYFLSGSAVDDTTFGTMVIAPTVE